MIPRSFAAVLAALAFIIGILTGGARSWESAPSSPVFETKSFREETSLYILESAWPAIRNTAVNQSIEYFVTSTLDEFRRSAIEYAPQGDIKSSISIAWDYAYVTDRLASFRFSLVSYTGGAHGNQVVIGKNYALPDGKELALSDLFIPGTPYLERISSIVREELRERLKEGFFEDGAAARPENYQSFTLAADRITFHFSPYDVAAYASGPQEVEISFDQIRDMLR